MAAERRGLPVSRRQFVRDAGAAGLGLLAGCGRLPGQAQEPAGAPGKVSRIGFLTEVNAPAWYEAFMQGLQERGYRDGQNLVVEYRFATTIDQLRPLAEELVRLRVAVLVAGSSLATHAATQATSTVPIVMAISTDPVEGGFVSSLAHPGGNVTGMSLLAQALSAKRLELLKTTVPGISRVAVLWNAANPSKASEFHATQTAAGLLGLELQSLAVRSRADFESAFEAAAKEHAEALFTLGDGLLGDHRETIVALAAQHRLPAMYSQREIVDVGGMMSYSASFPNLFRRAAYYVDRILKGTKPADLPVEQPMLFDFVINLRTAQALGLTIPPHVLLRATEIIQ